MTVASSAVSVGTTATEIWAGATGSPNHPTPVSIFNNAASGGTVLYIGGEGVTVGAGFPIPPQTGVTIDAVEGDSLFGIVSTGTVDARLFQGRL